MLLRIHTFTNMAYARLLLQLFCSFLIGAIKLFLLKHRKHLSLNSGSTACFAFAVLHAFSDLVQFDLHILHLVFCICVSGSTVFPVVSRCMGECSQGRGFLDRQLEVARLWRKSMFHSHAE